MKTYPVNKPYNPGRLSDELVAAGVNVVTIAGSDSIGGTVTTDDLAVDATVNATIAAHSVTPTLQEKLDGHLLDVGMTLAACVEAIVRIKVNNPAALNGAPVWATNQITAAHTFIQNQGG